MVPASEDLTRGLFAMFNLPSVDKTRSLDPYASLVRQTPWGQTVDLHVWGTFITVLLPLGEIVRLALLQRHPLLALRTLDALFLHRLDELICEEVRSSFRSVPTHWLLGKDFISTQAHEGICIKGQWRITNVKL